MISAQGAAVALPNAAEALSQVYGRTVKFSEDLSCL